MKPTAAAIFLYVGSPLAALEDTILPSEPPIITSELWQCTTEVLSQYFDVPKPTGALLSAIQEYGDVLQKDCKPTETNVFGLSQYPSPATSLWCRFSTIAPSSLLSRYSSYGSVASSWWSAHSLAAVSLARSCPIGWYKAKVDTPGGAGWFNFTLVSAGCYEEAHPTTGTSTKATAIATTGTKPTLPGPKSTMAITSTATSTSKANIIVHQAESSGVDSCQCWTSCRRD